MNVIDNSKEIKKLLKQKALIATDLLKFEKTDVVDYGIHKHVKEIVYNVAKKDFEVIQEIIIQRLQNLERLHEKYQADDCKYALGNAGELICVFILKKKND